MIILLLMATAGCDATMLGLHSKKATHADQLRSKALSQEEASELQQALLTWRIVAQLNPQEASIEKHIQRIQASIARLAKENYQKGLAFLDAGQSAQARMAFLKVLRVDPTHRQALYQLKTRLQQPPRPAYKVQPGDSFTKIATDTYHDSSKAYVLAHFNGLNPRKPLAVGKLLILPQLDSKYLFPRSDIEALVTAAESAYGKQQYILAISLAERIIKEVPGHTLARQMAVRARYAYAMQLKQKGRYHAALEQFEMTPPGHEGRRKALTEIRRLINERALDEKLAAARAQMKNGDLAGAISITESILKSDPDHGQAKALQNEAGYQLGKALIEEGKENLAVHWLEKVDAAYADTALQLSMARARTKAAAEEHYRNGVKHFINEDLEAAIEEWQHALDLNPEHPKARQDMENATRLLDKWRELDKKPAHKSATD